MADATISRIERGRLEPSSTLVAKLADALKVTVDDLLASPKEARGKARVRVRPSISKLVAVIEDLDDGAIDDVTRAVKLLIGVGRRRAATTR